jgi:hypothetical protein
MVRLGQQKHQLIHKREKPIQSRMAMLLEMQK